MSERNKSKSIRTPNSIKKRARELRKAATPAETILWNQLRNRRLNGIKFRRQHPLGSYIVDFFALLTDWWWKLMEKSIVTKKIKIRRAPKYSKIMVTQ